VRPRQPRRLAKEGVTCVESRATPDSMECQAACYYDIYSRRRRHRASKRTLRLTRCDGLKREASCGFKIHRLSTTRPNTGGTRFGTVFSRQKRVSREGKHGTDARFPCETRQLVVLRFPRPQNGVLGVGDSVGLKTGHLAVNSREERAAEAFAPAAPSFCPSIVPPTSPHPLE
jgi:hypothetical protein